MQITANNCLPNFSPEALESLEEGEPNYRLIMPEIRRNLHGLLGGDYPTRKEYNILGQTLIQSYPCLADVDDPRGFVSIN